MSALFATSSLLIGGCIFGDGDGSPTATPEATPTVEVTASPTRVATAIAAPAELPPGLEVSAAGTWESRELRAGDDVPQVPGAFVFDVATGAGTLWSLTPESVEFTDFVVVETSPGGRYIIATGRPNHLVDTKTETSFSWSDEANLMVVDDRGYALFGLRTGCRLWVVDISDPQPIPLSAFEPLDDPPDVGGCDADARLSPDATELLVAVRDSSFSGRAAVFVVDLETGIVSPVAELETALLSIGDGPSDRAVFLTASSPGTVSVAAYRWADGDLTTVSIETGASADSLSEPLRSPPVLRLSPDRRWIAWADSDDLGTGFGAGGEAEWPVVVIASIETGVPVVRAQRVAITSGTVDFDWLADSSAMVVQSEDGFALLGTDGVLDPLPFPLAFQSDPVPLPAPDRADRFLYDGRIVDATGADLEEPPAVAEHWGDIEWSDGGTRLLVTRGGGGATDFGRGGVATLGLPARIVTGPPTPYPEAVRLRVASDGDSLSVRAGPLVGEELIGELPHGTLVTVARDRSTELCGERGCSIFPDRDLEYGQGWWIYVLGEDGHGDALEGWVSTEFVGWVD